MVVNIHKHSILPCGVGMTNRPKTAFITGIAGQDGAYLAEFLLSKNYDVHGLLRWDSYADAHGGRERLVAMGIADRIHLHYGDVTDAQALTLLIKQIQPDEIYSLAALSHVHVSFSTPASALDINTKGPLAVLEAVRVLGMESCVRIYQASSSEMFGSAPAPQNEATPFQPCSPYGVAKLSAYWMGRVYRESYGINISNGILFNHESALRGQDFVTSKIARTVVAIEAGSPEVLVLGNLESLRDWGHARDYVEGMWLMLQQERGDDYVLAIGEAHSVREFVERAFAQIGVRLEWRGSGVDEIARNLKTEKILVRVDPKLFRPKEVHHLLGDATKARRVLGWRPRYSFDSLVSDMVNQEREKLWQQNTRIGAMRDEPWKMTG